VPGSETSKLGGDESHFEQQAKESSVAGKCDKPCQEILVFVSHFSVKGNYTSFLLLQMEVAAWETGKADSEPGISQVCSAGRQQGLLQACFFSDQGLF